MSTYRIVTSVLIGILVFAVVSRAAGNPSAFEYAIPNLLRAMLLLAAFPLFWAWHFLFVAPKRLDAARVVTVQGLEERIHELHERLDQRSRWQRKAAEYVPAIREGRRRIVHWVVAIRQNDGAEIAAQAEGTKDWMRRVRESLASDFGDDVAERFLLGQPEELIIGESEPLEHQARLAELVRISAEIRKGELLGRV